MNIISTAKSDKSMFEHLPSMEFLSSFIDEEIYVIKEKPPIIIQPQKPIIMGEPVPVYGSFVIDFMGDNLKKVVVLVDYENERYIPANDKALLLKILEAVRLDLPDIALVNLHKQSDITLENLTQELKPVKIVGFGMNSLFTSGFPSEKIQRINETQIIYFPYSLTAVSDNIEFKKVIWRNLKILFPL